MREKQADISESLLKRRQNQSESVNLLRGRLDLLTGKDKVLMIMYLENGNSIRQIARLSGTSESNIARRIRRLTERLINGRYIICLKNRDKFTCNEMAVAKDYFLTGLSIKKVAAKRRWTYYRARKTIGNIRRIVKI